MNRSSPKPHPSNMSSLYSLCVDINQIKSPLSMGFLFLMYLCFGNYMGLYCHSRTILSRKISGLNILNRDRSKAHYRNGNNHSMRATSSMDMLCSPQYTLNYRENLKFHWRLQRTVGSNGLASILFSSNWVWFWSLILEGECSWYFSLTKIFWTLFICSYYIYVND